MKKYGVVSPEKIDKGSPAGDETKAPGVDEKKPGTKKKEEPK